MEKNWRSNVSRCSHEGSTSHHTLFRVSKGPVWTAGLSSVNPSKKHVEYSSRFLSTSLQTKRRNGGPITAVLLMELCLRLGRLPGDSDISSAARSLRIGSRHAG